MMPPQMESAGIQNEGCAPCSAFEEAVALYRNTAEANDGIHAQFTRLAWGDPVLARHRRYIEAGRLGFGDPAFHYMWKLLVEHLAASGRTRMLEIGVYKGQVLSLWALLLGNAGASGDLWAISPMQGSPLPTSPWKRRLLSLTSPKFRERLRNGDFYEDCDYLEEMSSLFLHFGLEPRDVRILRGLSTDRTVRERVVAAEFDLVYLDGDHTYDVVRADLDYYAQRVAAGGYLVTDDSGEGLPGTAFWKGHPSVSRAVEDWGNPGFANVLNCGHNRIFQRTG